MKRNQVNAILVDQTKRRKTIARFTCSIIFVSLVAVAFFILYINSNKIKYAKYNEDSNIDYKVYLKENKYFEKEYLEENNQYIGALIDYINTNFKYDMEVENQEVDYKYSYRIEAEVKVEDKDTKNALLIKKEELLKSKEKRTSEKKVSIIENIKVDYNHFNDLIRDFINDYRLDNVNSTLKINMYVNVVGSCEEFEDEKENESVMTLVIPLTTKTIAIDLTNELINTTDNVMVCETPSPFNFILVVAGSLFIVLDIYLVYKMVKYEIKTRSAENIYDKELKKILNNYRSYIQKANNQFDVKGYQPMRIDTFSDLLEIRDTIQQPILMIEQENKKGVYFIIPSNTKILYMYGFKVSDIRKQMEINTEKMDKDEFNF